MFADHWGRPLIHGVHSFDAKDRGPVDRPFAMPYVFWKAFSAILTERMTTYDDYKCIYIYIYA